MSYDQTTSPLLFKIWTFISYTCFNMSAWLQTCKGIFRICEIPTFTAHKKASTNKEHLNYFISLKAPMGDGAFLCINQHHSPFVTFIFTGFITAA
ncbi:hypothetical protein P288_01180 [Salmonella enterica subsp. arizonae serovar 18:z4,z23:- str. CVM N7307]|nr:hypothetical protein SEEDSL_019936 [Salmonella enterica subsp. enterica serovar Dublin str. SL1438]KHP15176.1 hypothetical protein QS21_04780 [Salmonella enterica subsp. enterica serovar Dublin]KOK71433.1 hypothetical protein AEW94_17290 [Salmonella enterica subsp. enterica serovar Typhimurium var. 5-]KSA86744.1 hypothetical protein LFZ9_01940 [Salmonella enterica subsp. enterica serovar Dublin str. SA20093032]KSU38903.1 hypothetical protein ABI57_24070 [Salmonella enterica subsp. enterica s